MKILVVCQHYWPEPFNTADVCEELVRRGHQVTVLTGLPNTGLKDGDVPAEYQNGRNRRQQRNGVTILRAWLHPRKTGAKNRVLNYLSFWFTGNKLARRLKDDYDVVIGYQFSPVMQVDPGLVYARKTGTPMLLYSFDLWPESLKAGGFSESSLPFKWIKSVSQKYILTLTALPLRLVGSSITSGMSLELSQSAPFICRSMQRTYLPLRKVPLRR